MKKRFLAVLLTMAMLFSVLPASALAAEGDTAVEPCTVTEGCTLEAGHEGECVLPDEPETMEGDTADVPGAPDADPVYDIGDDTTVIDQGLITVEQLQARIVALPDADALTGMDAEVQAEVYAEVCAIYDAIDEMTDEEAGALDVSALEEAAAFFTRQIMPLDEGDNDAAMSGDCGATGSESSVTWKLEQNNQDNENPTYTLTISGSGAMTDYDVNTNQSQNGYYKVTGSPWLSYADKITMIDLSTGITKIGKGAFNSCAITELPWSGKEAQYTALTEIGQFAFAGCTALTSVSFVPSITTYGNYAFEYCTNVTSVDWTNYQPATENSDKLSVNGVLVATGLFAECSSLGSNGTRLSLPERIIGIDRAAFRNTGYTAIDFTTDAPGVKVIEEQAFSGSNLTSITLPSADAHSDTKFGTGAFSGTNVTAISIPYYSQSDNANVSEQMFKDCTSLSSVVLGDGITSIGKNAFSGTDLSKINWPTSLTTIGDYAFNGANFEQLDIPATVTTIGGQAFYNNTQLKSVILRAASVSLGYGAFAQCSALETIDLSQVSAVTLTTTGSNTGNVFTETKDGSALYVSEYSVIQTSATDSTTQAKLYSNYNTAALVIGKATVDATKTGFEAVSRDWYTAKWYKNSDFSGDSVSEIAKTESNNRVYPVYYAKWTLDTPTVTVSADKTNIVSSTGSATLTATAEHGAEGVTYEYQWYTGTPDSGTEINGATSQTYEVKSLTSDTTYYCKVTAVNGNDKSEAATSNTVTIAVGSAEGSVVISDDKTTATYGDAPFTFTYTASGTATVESSNTSVATVSDSNGTVTVTIVGAGSATISVSSAASTEYTAASAEFTLTVAKATLTAPVLANYTATTTSITVTEPTIPTGASKVQYSIDDGMNWQDSNEFSGLTAGTSYSVIAKFVANDSGNYADSASSTALSARTNSNGGSSGGGGGTTTYTVTVDSAKNGTVSVSPKNASKGTTVTITVKPNSGYELDDLTVTDKNGDAVRIKDQGNGKYTFTMPASKITVEASFTEIEEQPAVSFVDVSTSAYYYDAVAWAVENGVTSGTSATTFSPDAACTRAQAVTFLWRAAGSPAPKSSVNPFTDVSTSAYYYDAVLWAVEQGITAGTGATTFSPDATCTRGQIVTFLYRADGTTTSGSNPFTDVADNAYYADAVKWAVAEGVTAGTSATTFSPDASCTRSQIVTFLYRAYAD